MVCMSSYESLELVLLATNGRMPVAGSGNLDINEYAHCISTSTNRVASNVYPAT